MSTSTPFATSLRIQLRVVHALLMREIITRYGRHNLGFAWLFAEPMLFTVGIMALWSTIHSMGSSHHIDAVAFALMSYSTVLVWRNTIGRCTLAVEPNTALLFHRNVRVLDLFLSRIALELTGATLSISILLLIMIVAGVVSPPADLLEMCLGWGLLCWYAASMALVVGGLCEYSELVERLWHPIAYFQLPVSGAFAMAAWLPDRLRAIVLLFPAPNCVEIFREGYFGEQFKAYYDIPYVVSILSVLTFVGLWIIRDVSSRVEPR
ncbi:ABC transporter permease [Caballeronia sp. LZ035]|uniref:ABC transporter permease n=1 Tax=Caballeronia sp. LZ035 TaxID=3038568 RepID=UPI0028564C2B|nr:ABC transporter permease [Caballeronia sp. LZ035]MDR5757604.1 ABC transporter permease [Caballeronia sp. LZ035]